MQNITCRSIFHPYQLTSLSWSFRERNAVRFAADLSILVSRGGVRFSGTRVWSALVGRNNQARMGQYLPSVLAVSLSFAIS